MGSSSTSNNINNNNHDVDNHLKEKKIRNDKGLLSVPFPEPPFRCNLGLSLTEANLSYRTRQLDAWIRDVLCCYRYMQDMERAAVRYFLDLDLSKNLDISIQDRLARGLVEAPRANLYIPAIIREKDASEILETMSARDGSQGNQSIRGPFKSSASESGINKKSSLWETASLASSTLKSTTNSTNIGRGSLFHGKIQHSSLTADKLGALQEQLQLQDQAAKQKAAIAQAVQIKNQYNITNSNSIEEKKHRLTMIDENEDIDDNESVNSDARSVTEDRELDEESLLHIGMGDNIINSKNKGSADQWVAREFNSNDTNCIIS